MNNARHGQRGVSLIEVLVAVIVTLLGLLGMVALQMRAYTTESESYQRSQASILLEDMANRIRANGANAAAYVADEIGVGESESCDAATTLAERDLCEWANLLRGSAETHEGAAIGAMTAGRSCISSPEADLYVITLAWQGAVPTEAPGALCGKNEFSDERLRRSLSTVVRIANLGG